MADVNLDFLAAGTRDATEPVKRRVARNRKPNPFEPKLAASWDARTFDPKRNAGAGSDVGKSLMLDTSTADQTRAVVRALRRAADALGLGLAIDAPSERDGKKITYLAGTVTYAAMPKRERKNGNGDEPAAESPELFEGTHGHDGYEDHDHPASDDDHTHEVISESV